MVTDLQVSRVDSLQQVGRGLRLGHDADLGPGHLTDQRRQHLMGHEEETGRWMSDMRYMEGWGWRVGLRVLEWVGGRGKVEHGLMA